MRAGVAHHARRRAPSILAMLAMSAKRQRTGGGTGASGTVRRRREQREVELGEADELGVVAARTTFMTRPSTMYGGGLPNANR